MNTKIKNIYKQFEDIINTMTINPYSKKTDFFGTFLVMIMVFIFFIGIMFLFFTPVFGVIYLCFVSSLCWFWYNVFKP